MPNYRFFFLQSSLDSLCCDKATIVDKFLLVQKNMIMVSVIFQSVGQPHRTQPGPAECAGGEHGQRLKDQECERRHRRPRTRTCAVCNPDGTGTRCAERAAGCKPAWTPNYRWFLVFLKEIKEWKKHLGRSLHFHSVSRATEINSILAFTKHCTWRWFGFFFFSLPFPGSYPSCSLLFFCTFFCGQQQI